MKFLQFIRKHVVTAVLLCAITIATVVGVIKVTASSVALSPSQSAVNFEANSVDAFTITCSSTISKDNAETEKWEWTSDDQTVATVGGAAGQCTIYPKSAGKTTVTGTVTLEDNGGNVTASESARIAVTVNLGVDTSAVTGIMAAGGTATVSCNGSATHPVTWSSSNSNIVSVVKDSEEHATLNFISGGTATITASIPQDSLVYAFTVTVGVSIDEESIEVKQGETKSVTTNSNSASSVIWWTGDANVATVENGNITGIYAGTTTIFGSCIDGDISGNAGDSVQVTVPYEVAIVDKTVTIGDQIALTTTANPSEVNFYSENNNIISYDPTNRVFIAQETGTCIIHAVWNGSDTAYEITVIDGFSISNASMYLNIGQTGELIATTSNLSGTNPVYWTISDDTIATVEASNGDGTGYQATVTALATGQTTVIATQTINGIVKTCKCVVYVLNPVTSLTLLYNGQEINDVISVSKGSSLYITAFLNIEDGTLPDNTKLSWVSSDDSVITVTPTTTEGQQQLCKITAVNGGLATITVVTDDGLYIKTADFYVTEGVTDIQLDASDVTEQMALKKYQLTATIIPDSAGVDKSVIWSTLDPSVVTVDQNGLVTFVAPGTTYVLATSVADPSKQASCKFTITQQVEDVETDFKSVTLNVGEEYRLSALITPSNATNQNVTWSSSNTSVVKVDETGLLTAISSGSATIIVQTEDGGYIDTTNVTVLQPVTSITLSNTEMSVRKGTVFYLGCTINPDTADDKSVTWASSDTSLAVVDQTGKVTTLQVGSVTISCTSNESGVVAYCLVDISEPVTDLELNSYYEEIVKGSKFVLIPTVLPLDAPDRGVTFLSSDPEVATVDENGIITAVMGGTAQIVVTTHESGLTESCTIVVKEFVETVTITGAPELLNVGDDVRLTAVVVTETASNQEVIWSSSNKKIATVDQNGVVIGKAEGKVVITAVAADGSGASDSVVIRVIKPVKEIKLSDTKITIYVGDTYNVVAEVLPEDASITELRWESDNESIAKAYEDGDIVGIAAGRTVVRVHSTDGNDVTASCTVIVKDRIMATSLTLDSHEITMLKGKTRKLTTRLFPLKTNEFVKWTSSDTSVVQVDSEGNIVTVGAGLATVTAYTNYGTISDSCIVHSIAMHTSSLGIEQYDTFNLYVDGAPKTISWRSSNPRIASVDSSGMVIARMPGECTITATTDNKTVTCFVKVYAIDPGKFINTEGGFKNNYEDPMAKFN